MSRRAFRKSFTCLFFCGIRLRRSGSKVNRDPAITAAIASALLLIACQRAEPLTAQKAEQILRAYSFSRVPVYAELPQKVWWDEQHPKDDFDEKSVRTLNNLARAGYLTVDEKHDNH